MTEKKKIKKDESDLNILAHRIVREATKEKPSSRDSGKGDRKKD